MILVTMQKFPRLESIGMQVDCNLFDFVVPSNYNSVYYPDDDTARPIPTFRRGPVPKLYSHDDSMLVTSKNQESAR